MTTKPRATVDDLYQVEGKAELVNGEIVQMSPTGDVPSRAASAINARLRGYEASAKTGRAYGDNTGFLVRLPGRQSFSPDVAFFVGPRFGGKFLEGAPIFAVEVRSEGDYGERAERKMAAKRADYFAAGTQVVWDVDVLRGELIRVFRATDPENPALYRRGEIADAEPALPGFRMPVDEIFE
ncbi:MAG TPA: Uma2 family endonuclease [Vicinamibacteria bacterium]|nr:Uma2 family endonuclease [Vicinamibacteria bacterium]